MSKNFSKMIKLINVGKYNKANSIRFFNFNLEELE